MTLLSVLPSPQHVRLALRAPAAWPPARWAVALGAAVLCALLLGLPTAVIPNPVFGRTVPPEWWNYPALAASALLAGLLLATYVRTGRPAADPEADSDTETEAASEMASETASKAASEMASETEPEARRSSRLGSAGAVLSFLAVGCPVCNKLVLLALGTSGALSIWAPLQPALAVLSLGLLAVAAVRRLAGEVACPATPLTTP
ncbi:hypothetical protein [Streptomyces sp. NPDC002851]